MDIQSDLQELSFESKIPLITIILATLIALIGGYFKLKASLLGKKLPPGTLGFPLVGESISFVRAQKQDKTNEWIQKHINKYGPVFKTSLLGSKTVVLTGQAGNRFVFSGADNGISFKQPKTAASILGKHSLFEISGSRHKLIRGAIASFLKPESIQRYLGKMDLIVQQQLHKELDGKDSVRIVTLMKQITFNVTSSIFFGLPDGKEKDDLLEDFTIAAKGAWAIPLNFPGTVFHTALKARSRVCKLLSNLVSTWKKEMEEGTVDYNDNLILNLLVLRDENGEPLLEEEILDIFLSLMMASHETTTILLIFLIRHLARHAEVSNKVLEEQKEVVNAKKGSDGKLAWGEMQMMKYTWRVAQELMRFYPPLFGNFRRITRDITFDGFDIPRGWQLFWVASGTHMDKNIFEDPDKFDPSRFESSLKTFPPYTYIPFGAGPRICPGAEFARIEALLIIHHLITKYQWTEMIPDEPITREPLPYPAKGFPVKLHPRSVL